MLGSFVIGLFAASSTVGLANKKAIVVLHKNHSWQHNFSIQIGIRTGFCGSLTTFSSWVKELVVNAITYNEYMNGILGLIVGLYAAIASYMLGVHLALYVDHWLHEDPEDILQQESEYRKIVIEEYRAASKEAAEMSKVNSGDGGNGGEHGDGGSNRDGSVGGPRMVTEAAGLAVLSDDQAGLMAAEDDLPRIMINHPSDAMNTSMSAAWSRQVELKASPPPLPKAFKTDFVAVITLILLTSWCIVGAIIEGDHSWLRTLWLALLFAPFGCTLRWLLARLNYKLKGKWAWAPVGTFSANMLGTAISTASYIVSVKVELTSWESAINSAVVSGFCGALSTVSTFVTEIVQYLEVFPESVQAYTYAVGTLVSGVVLVIALYGWVVWS
jgi:CrcB protein